MTLMIRGLRYPLFAIFSKSENREFRTVSDPHFFEGFLYFIIKKTLLELNILMFRVLKFKGLN